MLCFTRPSSWSWRAWENSHPSHGSWTGGCFAAGLDQIFKQLEVVKDAVQWGHVCHGLRLNTMNTCLLPYICVQWGMWMVIPLINTSLVRIAIPFRWLMRVILPAGVFFRGTPFENMNIQHPIQNGTGGFIQKRERDSTSRNSHGFFPWLDIFLDYQVAVCCLVSLVSLLMFSSPWVPSPGSWWPLHGWDPVADAGALRSGRVTQKSLKSPWLQWSSRTTTATLWWQWWLS